jgi:signal transduction histidine kinase
MINKRDLGIAYLIGSGLLLFGGLMSYFWTTRESLAVTAIGTLTAGTLTATLPYTGWSLRKMDLSEEFVWKIAEWCGLGLGIATGFALMITFARQLYPPSILLPSLIVNNIAAGGVVGLLIGAVSELRKKTEREQELNHRNTALNRVLRHNIKNDINIVLGHVDLLRDQCDETVSDNIESIERKGEEILQLSQAARRIDAITENRDREPTSATALIEEYTTAAQDIYSEAEFSINMPDDSDVLVDPLLRSILQNLVENAIEHTEQDPEVAIDVAITARSEPWIEITVADNGPGIPADQVQALESTEETALQHGEGLGLCLVKWFVEEKGGTLTFEHNQPRGTIVRIAMPAIQPNTRKDGPFEDGKKPTKISSAL